MADKGKYINEVIEDVEEMSDQELNAIAGGAVRGCSNTCPAGQVLMGNKCVKIKKPS